MFKTNELIIYGNDGVCKVEEICKLDVPGIDKTKLYYVLKPLYYEGKIYVPIDSTVIMRSIITDERAKQLIDLIPTIKVEVRNNNNLREISDYYKSFQLHNCEDLIRLIKTVYVKKGIAVINKKKLGQTDENYKRKAEDLLYGELAAALNIPKENIKSYIENRVEAIEQEY